MADLSTAKQLVLSRIGQTQAKMATLQEELDNLDTAFKILVLASQRPHDTLELLQLADTKGFDRVMEDSKPPRKRKRT